MATDAFPNLKGTIFIVTYGRSGSTLLQSLLQSIPGAHIVGENYGALEGLFRAAQQARKARQTWGRKAHPQDHPWYNADRIRPVRFEQRLADVFVQEVLRPPQDVRWFGFKEIRFASLGKDFDAFLNFHKRVFPNAFFVFNSRNGEDVVKSAWWKDQPRDKVLNMIRTMDGHFARFAAANPECAHHVFYENTVSDPASLQPLFDKLGEPLDLEAVRDRLDRQLTHGQPKPAAPSAGETASLEKSEPAKDHAK